MTFKEQIEKYLSSLPEKWKDELVQILCLIKEGKQEPDCNTVKECETVTTLSDFTVNGTTISIQYKNEAGVTVTRSFDAETIINEVLDDIDPACLATEEEWESLTFLQRMQLLVDKQCSCCNEDLTFAYDSTAITGCSAFTDPIIFTLIGQEGQGVYSYVIEQGVTSTIGLPFLSGDFTVFMQANGSDYATFDIQDFMNNSLLSGATDGGGVYGWIFNPSGTFSVENMDHIIFGCQSSG
jgi:hypothetical protein